MAVRYVFMMLLAIADQAGDVIGTDVAIARRINIGVPEFRDCIAALMEADPNSNSQEQDGRRVVESEGSRGYHLVNYLTYRGLKTVEDRREYMRSYMAKRRCKQPVNTCKQPLAELTHAEAEEEADANGVSESKDSSPAPPDDKTDFAGVVALFHELCPALPRIRTVTPQRKTAIRARWKAVDGRGLEWFRELFAAAQASDFISGRSGRWPGCNFDWLMSPTNAQKVIEQNYGNERQQTSAPNGTSKPRAEIPYAW